MVFKWDGRLAAAERSWFQLVHGCLVEEQSGGGSGVVYLMEEDGDEIDFIYSTLFVFQCNTLLLVFVISEFYSLMGI